MSLRYLYEPELVLPDMVCAWPGIGQVALTVAGAQRSKLDQLRVQESAIDEILRNIENEQAIEEQDQITLVTAINKTLVSK